MTDSFIQSIQRSKSPESSTDTVLSEYEIPLVTVDIVVFTIQDDRLKALLIQRKQEPFIHMWAIPGGFIHEGETLEEAAGARLQEETNVHDIFLEQLYAFGKPGRDPRARVITVAYYALVSSSSLKLEAHANAENIGWHCITELPDLAFDHRRIVDYALSRLKTRLESTPIAFQLLPEKFTLTELQRVYELILEKKIDKRNFRKKIISSGILKDVGETKMEGYHRPAQLYCFSDTSTLNANLDK
ncbi:MAG: NUDIX hydrolase [Vampirovibrio sp.]|nr:NUDIX hydrolase [Vampirovibrio sp.]